MTWRSSGGTFSPGWPSEPQCGGLVTCGEVGVAVVLVEVPGEVKVLTVVEHLQIPADRMNHN